MSLPFRDRHDAGRHLADKLHCYAGRDTIVLGLPRGGMAAAYEVAHALQAQLDIFLLRHLRLPGDAGATFGLVASGGVRVLRRALLDELGIPPHVVEEVTQREHISLIARERTYRAQQSQPDLRGRDVVLVDDGTAAEELLADVVTALRQHEPRAIIIAVPVLTPEAARRLKRCADDVVYVATRPADVPPERWYVELLPLSHTEVRALLSLAAAEAQSRELAGLARI
jgi:putative phosphoribosyl transferase